MILPIMRVAAGAIVVALWSLVPSAQTPFRAGTDVIPVYATVRGEDGHLLTGLQQNAFTLLERGTRVPLAVFSNEPQPITVAMMVDMSGQIFAKDWYEELRQGLLAFVDELRPEDRARIGTFKANEIAVGFHLTSDHVELRRVIKEEVWHGGGGNQGRPLWNAIGAGMKSLENERGRRVVLVMTHGYANTVTLPGMPGEKQLQEAIATGDFMVYGVLLFEGNVLRPVGWQPPPVRGLTLGQMVDATGGGYFRALPGGYQGKSDPRLRLRLAAIVDELRHQYVLGFVPRHRDGRAGAIEVRVNRPGATVAARKSYQAPAGGS
jgi:VWFA-related protein